MIFKFLFFKFFNFKNVIYVLSKYYDTCDNVSTTCQVSVTVMCQVSVIITY